MTCSRDVPCDKELCSCHYALNGRGIVVNEEIVIYVVFDRQISTGDKLSSGIFDTGRIGRNEMSLARMSYTTFSDIQAYGIGPALNKGKELRGATIAEVSRLRGIMSSFGDPNRPTIIRGVCITDEVKEDDHEGHASLGVCKNYLNASQSARSKIKAAVAADMAEIFSPLQEVASFFQP